MTGPDPSFVAALLRDAAMEGPFELERLAGGRNNQVYRVALPHRERPVLLKSYFHGPTDSRDRAGTEWAFSCFAWTAGLRCLAQPLAWRPADHLVLFDFLPGSPLAPGTVGAPEVAQALTFVGALNRHRAAGKELATAAEACFSFGEHVDLVRCRLARLSLLSGDDPITHEARHFVREELAPSLEKVVATGRASLARAGLDPAQVVPAQERCVSPSDFGFHNALRRPDGTVSFFDFEYAGWDDPAKLVADFFNQIAVPVPSEFYELFVTNILADLGLPAAERARFDALTELYAIKWAMIALNEFFPDGRDRRNFATPGTEHDRRRHQLSLARSKLASLEKV